MRKLAPLLLLPFFCGTAHATDWYVDGRNGVDGPSGGYYGPVPNCGTKTNTRGTLAAPFQNFWCAQKHAMPGDTIHLMPTMLYSGTYITAQGKPGAPITIVGDGVGSNLTRVINGTAADNQGWAIDLNTARYVDIRNFDVTLINPLGNRGSSGIQVSSSDHIGLYGNVIHDVGGNGISTMRSDYLIITGNVIRNNGWDTSTGLFNSGISVLRSANTDSDTQNYKIVISGNTVYGNHNLPRKPGDPCGPNGDSCTNYYSDSDGNGIIMDRNDGTSGTSSAVVDPYKGRTLITNNVVFGNGGRGIHVYRSSHVDVTNNTLFFNNQDPYECTTHSGEIEVNTAGDVQVFNNVAYSDGANPTIYGLTHNAGRHVGISVLFGPATEGNVVVDYNLLFNLANDASLATWSGWNANQVSFLSHEMWGDPKFVNATIDPATANFQLLAGSPALKAANWNYAPTRDMLGAARRWLVTDLGAFQQSR